MDYFSSKKSLYHYINMAEGNYREYLKDDLVKAKKYFYVLRPILACRWVLDKRTPPSMLFSKLVAEELPFYLKNEVDRLLKLKMNSPEIKKIPRIDLLNTFIETEISDIKYKVQNWTKDQDSAGWEKLNLFFWNTIHDDSLRNS